MKTTVEWLEAIKANTGATSDYQLAKLLSVTRQQISRYRNYGDIFSDETCFKVASILDIDPILVFASVHAQKSKNEIVKANWKVIFERLGGVAASVVFATAFLSSPTPAKASDAQLRENVYYVKSRKRKKIPNPLEFLVQQMIQV